MNFELITFRFCPFGQRSLILLHEKGVEFKTTFVDLSKPPEWLDAVSPLGKVPVLRVDGRTLFDSAVINEFLDDLLPPSLQPDDAFDRAWQRAWIAFAGTLLETQLAAYSADSEELHREKLQTLQRLVALLANEAGDGSFFAGARFGLADAAFAPFFLRFRLIHQEFPSLGLLPGGLQAWEDSLLARRSVRASIPAGFDDGYRHFLRAKGSWLLRQP